MSTFDELKQKWGEQATLQSDHEGFSQGSMAKIIRSRINTHTRESFKYFWASFILQLIVYALLSHTIIKYRLNPTVLYPAIAGVILYIPFTVMLLQKFKKMAVSKPLQPQVNNTSIRDYLMEQLDLLTGFYKFKKWYELFLIPLGCAIGVFVSFELFLPGGIREYTGGAIAIFLLSLASCAAAIYAENKKSFEKPISQIRNILQELDQNDQEESFK